MTPQQIAQTLRLHELWLEGDSDGERADLSHVNLFRSDLSGASLFRANLVRANLFQVNLADADLAGADLCASDLTAANLTGANLTGANLFRADLALVNATGANLSGSLLGGANLGKAFLAGADLTGADLTDTNLSCSRGLTWGHCGPIGTLRCSLTAVLIGNETILHARLCSSESFRGTPDEFAQVVERNLTGESNAWDWPRGDADQLADECWAAMEYVLGRIEATR